VAVRLNGWQRLWIIVSVPYLVLVVALTTLLWPTAATTGHRDEFITRNNLGFMHAHGRGVPQDYAEAVKWLRRAAEQGLADAQNDLGCMYAHGRGVPQDYLMAHIWYNLATSRRQSGADFDTAVKNRDLAAHKMTRAQIAEALQLASEWKPRPEQAPK
jgi:Sel1 repeat-containing protein